LDERKSALADIRKIYPDYLKGIDLERTAQVDLKKKIDEANKSLENSIRLKIYNEQLEEVYRKRIAAEEQMKNPQPSLWDYIYAGGTPLGAEGYARDKAKKEYLDTFKQENDILAKINETKKEGSALDGAGKKDTQDRLGLLGQIDDQIKKLQAERPLAKSVDDIVVIDDKIKALEARKHEIEIEIKTKETGPLPLISPCSAERHDDSTWSKSRASCNRGRRCLQYRSSESGYSKSAKRFERSNSRF